MTRKTKKKINILKEWLQARNYTLHIGDHLQPAIILYDEKEIYIPDEPDSLSYLLHECGHLYLYMDKHDDPFSLIDEEIAAWRRGALLAKELGLGLPRRYWKVAKECVATYLG